LGENTRVDFVVADGPALLRIQVKTGRLRDGVIVFNTCSFTYHHPGNRGGKPYRQDYRGHVDLFAVWCPGTRAVYLVPADDVPTNGARLRLQPTRNNQSAGVRWAADYQLHPPE
jgi:hypothetical protein